MVTTLLSPRSQVLSEPAQSYPPSPTAEGPTAPLNRCPKCDGTLTMGYDEPRCIWCGFQDYSYTPEVSAGRQRSILSSATRFVVRYVGSSPALADVTTEARAVRMGNRLVHQVMCPFCEDGKLMAQASLSGRRREVREERFRCVESHCLSLTPARNGVLAWK